MGRALRLGEVFGLMAITGPLALYSLRAVPTIPCGGSPPQSTFCKRCTVIAD